MRILRTLIVTFSLAIAAASTAYAVDDGHGKDWKNMPTSGVPTWEQVAAVCPPNGVTPCNGKLGTVNMKDWIWATAPQVRQLFGYYAPAILASPTQSVSGYEYYSIAAQFQSVFGITQEFRGCPTYQPCWWFRLTNGMTATTDGTSVPAVPYGGQVNLDLEYGSGSFRIYKPMQADVARGLWMWRPTGLGTNNVYANDDAGQPPTPAGGVAVANVLANDWVGGARTTTANVSLSLVSSSIAGVSLDLADGSVDVASGTASGSYTLVYRICNRASPANCDDATVTVGVGSFVITAANDQGATSMAVGGTAIANVLANDKLGGATATTAVVRLSQVSTTHPGVTLDLNDGSVDVARGTTNGTHTLIYRICERANLANCAQATATVGPFTIDAVNDYARGSSKTGGIVIASVLNNDWFNGARATTAKVTISLPAPLPYGITLNRSSGAVSVAPKTSSGTYNFDYRICETLSPTNCDQATVTLDLSGRD